MTEEYPTMLALEGEVLVTEENIQDEPLLEWEDLDEEDPLFIDDYEAELLYDEAVLESIRKKSLEEEIEHDCCL